MIACFQHSPYNRVMAEIFTTERMLILLLFFCMGARYLEFRVNGRSIVLRGEKPKPDGKDN